MTTTPNLHSAPKDETVLNRQPVRRAVALLSGGLDSAIAAKLVKDQGIDVIGLHLASPFTCHADVQKTADEVGIPLVFRDKGEAFLDLLEDPQFGRGKAMNPCIDCRIYMFQLAEKVMLENKADFVVTGEVLGQRPMSQQPAAMSLIDRKSPIEGRVVRPLSAHVLEPTIPELENWVDRTQFLGISGRGRKEQLALANELGLKTFSAPGGGCLLTETGFSGKLQDFFKYKHYTSSEGRIAQSKLLRIGRHFRLSPETKCVLGRNQEENQSMTDLYRAAEGVIIKPHNFDGPTAILLGEMTEATRNTALSLIGRYGKPAKNGQMREVELWQNDSAQTLPISTLISESELEGMRL